MRKSLYTRGEHYWPIIGLHAKLLTLCILNKCIIVSISKTVLKVVSVILGRNINYPIHLIFPPDPPASCPPHKQDVKKMSLYRTAYTSYTKTKGTMCIM